MLSQLLVYFGCILLVCGAAFSFLAVIGVLRLPDLYTRMHAASKAGAVGGGLVLLSVAFLSQDVAVLLRAFIGIIFLLLTTPVSAHLLARASYFAGHKPQNITILDEFGSARENSQDR
jgi:multicomponent Na+:H+ antiporter subunit G